MHKFKIPVISSSNQKSIRFPNDLVDKIESHIVGTECSFSAFIIAVAIQAIQDLEEENDINLNV